MESGSTTASVLRELETVIAARAREGDVQNSHTAQLLAAGPLKCAKKLGEEGVEAALACASGSRQEFVGEAADLLYHLMVALAVRGVPLEEVAMELARRRGFSGLEEKAGRSGP